MALHSPNGIALCAGGGGLELGLHIAEPGYRAVCYVEQDAHAAATLVARMAEKALGDAPLWDNLRSFDGRPWRGKVDIITAGYPCQPFSSAGRRRGEEDPRHLWPEVARIIEECRPTRVFLENVMGHLSLGFDVVARELQGMGFDVAAGVFSAREVGAPHYRRRLFLLADTDRGVDRGLASRGDRRDNPLSQADVSIPDQPCGVRMVSDLGPVGSRPISEGKGPLFAPGPGDLDAWRRILRRDPGLKPSFRRDADGMAGWLERSSIIGNGVCSLAAAYAYRTLRAALKERRGIV